MNGKVAVKLYSAEGKLLQNNSHYLQNSTVFTQDISKLSNGVYFIGITNATGIETTKILVVVN